MDSGCGVGLGVAVGEGDAVAVGGSGVSVAVGGSCVRVEASGGGPPRAEHAARAALSKGASHQKGRDGGWGETNVRSVASARPVLRTR